MQWPKGQAEHYTKN